MPTPRIKPWPWPTPTSLPADWELPHNYMLLDACRALLDKVQDPTDTRAVYPLISELPEDHYDSLIFTQHGMRPISCWCHALIMHWTYMYSISIPVFYSVWDTVRIFLGYGKINSVWLNFLEYSTHYKTLGY